MTKNEIMTEFDIILEEAKTAVLATIDAEGRPHMRWMTPCVLKDRQDSIFALTSPAFAKTKHLEKRPEAQWMIQTPLLDTIITLRGNINLLDNSALKSEIIEVLGPRLTMFWKLNEKADNLIVLETVLEEAMYYKPMHGFKKLVSFGRGE